jgi:hypothetical protein
LKKNADIIFQNKRKNICVKNNENFEVESLEIERLEIERFEIERLGIERLEIEEQKQLLMSKNSGYFITRDLLRDQKNLTELRLQSLNLKFIDENFLRQNNKIQTLVLNYCASKHIKKGFLDF